MTKSILIVDDSPMHLEQLTKLVASLGHKTIQATSGKEAIEQAHKHLPDLIFLDIVMDDMDGYGACRAILAEDKTKDIPVVFVSTKNQRADKLWALKQGARALICKPYEDQSIIDEIAKY